MNAATTAHPSTPRPQFDRAGLVRRHLPLVCAVASKIHRQTGRQIPMGDLIGFGLEGAFDAAVRYDPGRGQLFSTYAYRRIRGAIYDRMNGWSGPRPSRCAEPREPLAAESSTEDTVCRREVAHRVLAEVTRLSPREQHLIRRCYGDEAAVSEVARELGISQSRASHIHAGALRKLRASLADCAPE